MNEARPAVQLACPYQLVKTAPSFAILSMLGVGWPRFAPPSEYAPKSFHPVSSVMSMTMLGFSAVCAARGVPPASITLEMAIAPIVKLRTLALSLRRGLPRSRLQLIQQEIGRASCRE